MAQDWTMGTLLFAQAVLVANGEACIDRHEEWVENTSAPADAGHLLGEASVYSSTPICIKTIEVMQQMRTGRFSAIHTSA